MSGDLAGASHVPLGEGLVVRRVRVAPGEVVHLRAILAGYDGLASAHGDRRAPGIVVLVGTADREAELDAWIDELGREIALERVGASDQPAIPSSDTSRSPTR